MLSSGSVGSKHSIEPFRDAKPLFGREARGAASYCQSRPDQLLWPLLEVGRDRMAKVRSRFLYRDCPARSSGVLLHPFGAPAPKTGLQVDYSSGAVRRPRSDNGGPIPLELRSRRQLKDGVG